MRIGVVTISTPEIEHLAQFSRPNKKAYCKLWSHPFIESDSLDRSRHPSWSKVLLVLQELSSFDYLWCTDVDSMVTNPTVDLCRIIAADPGADLIIARDNNGINSGQYIVKNTRLALEFFRTTYCIYPTPDYWEQWAMMRLLERQPPLLRTAFIPKRAINSYSMDWRPGDFLIHLADVEAANREDAMRKTAARFPFEAFANVVRPAPSP